MPGIIEKGTGGLFENEIEFTGQYAEMARELRDKGLFTTFREAYITSAVIGFSYNQYDLGENSSDGQSASIFASDLNKRKRDLRFLYRIIMLLKEEPNFSLDDYKNRALKDDPEENSDLLRENMRIFNAYACGGVKYLFQKFSSYDSDEKMSDALYEFVHQSAIGMGLQESEELPDFSPKYN